MRGKYMYKLRVYNKKCEFDHEEFFTNVEEMITKYDEIFNTCNVAPTAWSYIDNEWCRIAGY